MAGSPGQTCMVTVRDHFARPWCGDSPGVAVRVVPPRQVVEHGRTRVVPGYEETMCARHHQMYLAEVAAAATVAAS